MSSLKYTFLLCVVALMAMALPLCAQSLILLDPGDTYTGWTLDGSWAVGSAAVGTSGQATYGEDPAEDADAVAGGTILGYAIGANYAAIAAGSEECATSPSIDCTGAQDVTLVFSRWLAVGDATLGDNAAIEYSIDGGTEWLPVWANPAGPAGGTPVDVVDTAWMAESYALADAGNEADVMVRFVMGPTTNDFPLGGWSIDNLQVVGAASEYTLDSASFPSQLTWDETADMAVTLLNSGESTWDDSFVLEEICIPTAPANRWGVGEIAVDGTVAPDETYDFEATMMAPPMSSIVYAVPFSPTASAAADQGLAAVFDLYDVLGPVVRPSGGENPSASIVVDRFPDDSAWARFYIEELAARVPLIVQGYPNGTYQPARDVTRGQIAVYVVRAADDAVTIPVATAPFRDVPVDYWAAPWIDAGKTAGYVTGYADGTYRPENLIDRQGMCKLVAQASGLTEGGAALTFSDADEIAAALVGWVEVCVDNQIVLGYPNGTFQPARSLTRDQLAVFVWRGFMRDVSNTAVIGGPAFTEEDVASANCVGFPSVDAVTPSGPVDAYVVVDSVMAATPAGGGASDIVVVFELRDAATPTSGAVLWTDTVTIPAATLNAQAALALAGTGETYVAGAVTLDEADLTGIIGTETGLEVALTTIVDGVTLSRMPTLVIGTLP